VPSRSSDADARKLAGGDAPVVVDARHVDGGDHGRQDADTERHGESLDRPGPELEQDDSGEERRHVRVDDRGQRTVVAGLDRRARRFSGAELFAYALVNEHIGVDGHTGYQHDAGDAGQREHGSERREDREQKKNVENKRDVRQHSRAFVVDKHENNHERAADDERDHALADRVAAERRAVRALFGDFERRRERARSQDNRERARVLHLEAPGDGRAAAADALLNDRRGVDFVVQDNREPAFDVFGGDTLEEPRARVVKHELDVWTFETRARAHVRVGDIGARHERLRLEQVRRSILSVENLSAGRRPAFQRVFDAVAIIDQLEFEQSRLLDELLRLFGILNAGQLDENFLLPLALDDRLADAELIDAVANRLERLLDRLVAQRAQLFLRERKNHVGGSAGNLRVDHREVGKLALLQVADLVRAGRRRPDPDLSPLPHCLRDGDIFFLCNFNEIVLDALHRVLNRLIDFDFKDEMSAALEVEAEMNTTGRKKPLPQLGELRLPFRVRGHERRNKINDRHDRGDDKNDEADENAPLHA